MRILLILILLLGATVAQANTSTTPSIVVTLKPVHALIAGVMAGAGEPHLLISTGADPHSHALRPSEARALAQADGIFWIGPGLEGYLQKPLASLAANARIVTLSKAPGLHTLAARRGGVWGPDHGHDHDHENHDAENSDPHIWLDPRNAQAIVRQAMAVLADLDPGHGDIYRRNGDEVIARLRELEQDIHRRLMHVRGLPYMVLHDAFQYFEVRFGANVVGAIAIDPDRKPGARRISAIRKQLANGHVRCLFREAQFPAKLIATLTKGLSVRVASLDPIGLTIAPGPQAYGQLLRQLADTIENCLSYSIGP